jgi:excisionase family DNA binding protein
MNDPANGIQRPPNGRAQTVGRVQEQMAEEKSRRTNAAVKRSTTVMTLQEVADYLRVTRSTIHRLLKRNEIPAFRIGRHWRFNVEEIENWCASRASGKDPAMDA